MKKNKKIVGIIDYGMGNLHSVEQFFKRKHLSLKRIKAPHDLNNCNALILPGVGSFTPAMINLRKTNLIPELKKWALEKKPLLGICLGLQLMFESSDEGKEKGLGLIKGQVKNLPIKKGHHIPHMGWAPLKQEKECPLLDKENMHQWMYFVHSYYVNAIGDYVTSTTSYENFTCCGSISFKNIFACQFHPEKSADFGLSIFDCLRPKSPKPNSGPRALLMRPNGSELRSLFSGVLSHDVLVMIKLSTSNFCVISEIKRVLPIPCSPITIRQ